MTVPPDPDTTIGDWVAETLALAAEVGESELWERVPARGAATLESAQLLARCDPATITALVNVVAAADRRRQAFVNRNSLWLEFDQAQRAEDAALAALAARLRGEG